MSAAEILLFDLGGVIVDFRGAEGASAMTRGARSVDYCRDAWWRMPELDLLERGAIAPAQFADAFIREWDLDLDRAAFLDAFKRWVVAEFDGVGALLEGLRKSFRLACLSNVNEAHWERCVELGVDAHFDRRFLSFELRLRKPEPAIYTSVIAALGVAPREIFFVDDIAANVDAAHAAGMQAALVRNHDVAATLSAAGFL